MNDARTTATLDEVLRQAWDEHSGGSPMRPAQLAVLRAIAELEVALRAAGAPVIDPLEPSGPVQ